MKRRKLYHCKKVVRYGGKNSKLHSQPITAEDCRLCYVKTTGKVEGRPTCVKTYREEIPVVE